jgi:glutathione S-transferase/GST-like protein
MIELYHSEPGANSGEALICLQEKGIDFASRYVDVLAFEQFEPEFLRINPDGQVPVLVHDGRTLTETGFILQYLEAAFPTVSLTPRSAQDRYWVNVWIKYVNEYLAPALWRLGTARQGRLRQLAGDLEKLERAPPERRQAWLKAIDGFSADELEIARGLLPVRLERMQQALAASSWLAGPDYSLADIMVFPTAAALPQVAPELVNPQATPAILAWLERMAARPAVQAALAFARRHEPVFAPGPEGSRWG